MSSCDGISPAQLAAAIANCGVVYSGPNPLINPKLVWVSGTIGAGVLTLHPTSDGTATGNALMTTIAGIIPALDVDGSDYQLGTPNISGDNKTITIPVTKSTSVNIATVNVLAAPAPATSGSISVLIVGT